MRYVVSDKECWTGSIYTFHSRGAKLCSSSSDITQPRWESVLASIEELDLPVGIRDLGSRLPTLDKIEELDGISVHTWGCAAQISSFVTLTLNLCLHSTLKLDVVTKVDMIRNWSARAFESQVHDLGRSAMEFAAN